MSSYRKYWKKTYFSFLAKNNEYFNYKNSTLTQNKALQAYHAHTLITYLNQE